MRVKPLVDNFIKPEYKSASAGGMDIYFQSDVTLTAGVDNVVNLGFAAEVPAGHVALLMPRSGAGIKGIGLRNTVGVIDSDYYYANNDHQRLLYDKLEVITKKVDA